MRMLLAGVIIGFILSALAVAVPMVLAQAPPLQEFIPLGPDQQQPGQRPGEQPGQEECQTILFYHNGRLYRLSPGPQDGQGRPGVPPEFFYLNPYQGPAIPGFPQPFRGPEGPGPNFRPVLPRS